MTESDYDIDDLSLGAEEEARALALLRANDPVHWDPKGERWLLTRHADVRSVSRRPELFSSEPNGPWHAFESHFSMQAEDGAPHHRSRKVVSRGFTPRVTQHLAERVRRYADEAIDGIAGSRHFDLVEDIAVPVPMRIIADMLGLDANYDLFRRWVNTVTGAVSRDGQPTAEEKQNAAEFEAFVRATVKERKERPGDDLISTLLAGSGEGVLDSFARQPFPGVPRGDGVLGFIAFLVLAGSETTRHAISQGMRALIEHPAEREKLVAHPELMESATEEILRWTTPVRVMQRTVMRDTELCERKIERGSRVLLLYHSANRDERVFEEPEHFRVDRSPNDHTSFGFGSHFCLGANLARMEIRVTLERLLERLPGLELSPDAPPQRFASSVVNGLSQLPVVSTAGTRG